MSNPRTPSRGPVCPNHAEPLEDCGFPLPRKGQGRCPISGEYFDFEVEANEAKDGVKLDKFGNISKEGKWKIEGND